MQCMKCGRDVDPGQVFCDKCRETMAQYPVKPGIVVQLPRRTEPTAKKQAARRRAVLSAEEQNHVLRRIVRWQVLLVALLLVAVAGLSWLTVKLYKESEIKVLPGQNYYSAASNQETTKPTGSPTRNADD